MAHIIGQGDADGLRKVEKDVLIMKKVKKRSFEICGNEVKEFEDCVRGRTISAAWKCRQQNKTMKKCLVDKFQDQDIYELCKKEYLEEREHFRTTGSRKDMQKATGSLS